MRESAAGGLFYCRIVTSFRLRSFRAICRIYDINRHMAVMEKTMIKRQKVTLDDERHEVKEGSVEIALPPKEYEVIKALMSRPGKVFSRENLLSLIWGYQVKIDTRTVDQHVARMRKRFKECPIVTVHGYGYKFQA